MDKINSVIAKNIKKYRKLNKLTQKQLGELAGVSTAAVSNWETCTNSIDVDTLFKVCAALDVSISEIASISVDFELSPEEREIIDNYRKATDWEKLSVLKTLRCVKLPARLRRYWEIVNNQTHDDTE